LEVEQLEEDDYYGFEIDGNRRFVLYEYSVTHNTVMALKIGSILSKKMLILVHKEFLMNQWIERIQEFLPNARVGKIQGTKTEIEDKDIVIGMIQTMYNRSFQDGTFTSFGLTIIDEVHRIGSEEFSKTLLKTITPYMLGISATVERKDGLTKILYMFIGEKIYSGSRKDKDEVCVYGIDYISNDEEFDETEVDWKGNTKYSTMITKICDYGPRSQFIVTLLKDLMDYAKEHRPQIMVLSHNKSLLNYLHDAIQHGGFASVGYYVGGMKESALKITAEEKQVVLATYAMAAEALDIKTLSILIMATPKTDIEQSVGRILREKHAQPMVVDIIDSHSTFQNQWRKRKTFYRKNNYKILHCRSDKFKGFANTLWNTSFDPNQKKRGEKPCISLEQHEEDEEYNVSSLAISSKGCLLKWQE
jgi:superfamily II DNA or RNA helicase